MREDFKCEPAAGVNRCPCRDGRLEFLLSGAGGKGLKRCYWRSGFFLPTKKSWLLLGIVLGIIFFTQKNRGQIYHLTPCFCLW